MKIFFPALAATLCLFLTAPLSAQQAAKVHEYQLKNGLKILVKEDHRAPIVVSQVWYKVGSGYEHEGITGISHLLEHMMFKGTSTHPAGEFSRIISENGGRENAFTGQDYTTYFQQMASDRLAISFDLEADRMHNLRIDPAEFAKERKVVMEERRMRTDDDPQSLTYERFQATAFTNGPYHHSVIGWMDDIVHISAQQLQDWYQRWYAPNNATLVVVGDVMPREVLQLANKYFGPVPKRTLTPVASRTPITQKGIKRIHVATPAELPYLLMGYRVPVVRTARDAWEPYALEVLAGILDGGNSARLSRELIRGQQLAAQTGVSYDPYARHGQLFLLDGTPTARHTIAELEQALSEQVSRFQHERITPEALARVKNQVVASKVYEQDSVFYQAMQLGRLETVGLKWQMADQYVPNIQAVTAEQVQKVAERYLNKDQLTVGILDPQPINPAQARQPHSLSGSMTR